MPNEYHSLWHTMSAQWQDLALATGVGVVSGIASWLHKFRNQQPRLFSVVEFTADTLLAAFAANVAFMLCMWFSGSVYQLSAWAVASIIGIVAHKASRWLFLIDRWMMNRAKVELKINDDDA